MLWNMKFDEIWEQDKTRYKDGEIWCIRKNDEIWRRKKQVHKYTSTLVHKYTSTQFYKYTSTKVHKYTCIHA